MTKEERRRVWADAIREHEESALPERILYIYLKKPGTKMPNKTAVYYYGAVPKDGLDFESEYEKIFEELLDLIEEDWGDKPFEILKEAR